MEKLEGDDARSWAPPYWAGMSATFQSFNRNKRSVVVNLRDRPDLERLRRVHLAKIRELRQAMFIELWAGQRQSERGTIDRGIDFVQHVRQATDVILVTMCQKYSGNPLPPFEKPRKIGVIDVDAAVVVRETGATIDHHDALDLCEHRELREVHLAAQRQQRRRGVPLRRRHLAVEEHQRLLPGQRDQPLHRVGVYMNATHRMMTGLFGS